jgi:hypothetical protein
MHDKIKQEKRDAEAEASGGMGGVSWSERGLLFMEVLTDI